MSVHKSERKESPFEARDHAIRLKKLIRELCYVRNFGYKIREGKTPRNWDEWSEQSKDRWKQKEAERLERLRRLDADFLARKRADIDRDLMTMMREIAGANCLIPQTAAEADERRIHQDRAIAACWWLKVDLQDVIDTVPIDKNWMTAVAPEIEREINLIGGWRKSDNAARKRLYAAEGRESKE